MARKDCWRTIVVCLVLGLGTVALYFPVFTYGIANLDDQIYLTANPHVNQGVTAEGVKWAFQAGYAGNWHPVTWLSHMLDFQVFGLKAGRHHATSVVLHALNSVLLFLVLRRMTGAFWRSAAVAAFFAWHPLHVESVAWLAERKDVLSAFFWMLALWAYVRYAENSKSQIPISRLFYALALLFFALGLMAKPMLVTLPCVLLLIDWWPLGRLRFGAASQVGGEAPATPGFSSLLIEKIPFLLLSVGSCIITVLAAHQETVASAMARLSFKNRFITAGVSYFRYLEKTVWPSDLGPSYPLTFHRPKWELIAIALVLLGISIVAIRFRKSRPYWLMGWLWFLGMLVPALNLIFIGAQPMADRYMYLPSIGLFILICWDAADLAGHLPAGRIVLSTFGGLALAACCFASVLQLKYWRNEATLVARIAEPESNYMGHAAYALFLMRHNQLPEAQAECEKAISIMPGYAPFHGEMGEILLAGGRLDDAIAKFRVAQSMDPKLVDIHLPWGRALLAQKHLDDAASEFTFVINAEPKNFEAHKGLGETFEIAGRTAPAVDEFRRSLAFQPNQPDLLNNLAWILATDPRPEIRNGADAVKLAARACALTHGVQPIFLGTLAAAYAEAGRFDDAMTAAQKAHDVAASESNAAQKASQSSAAGGLRALAAEELRLLDLYRKRQPFHEKVAAGKSEILP